MANKMILQQRAAVNYATTIKVPDKRVVCCCPLDGSWKDLSRYNSTPLINNCSFVNSTGYISLAPQPLKYALINTGGSITPKVDLSWNRAWSIELCCNTDSAYNTSVVISLTNNMYIQSHWGRPSVFVGPEGDFGISNSNAAYKFNHIAITWDMTTLRVYTGLRINSYGNMLSINLNESKNYKIEPALSSAHVNGTRECVSNLRIIDGKAMHRQSGNTYTYLVPTKLYTGFESLD